MGVELAVVFRSHKFNHQSSLVSWYLKSTRHNNMKNYTLTFCTSWKMRSTAKTCHSWMSFRFLQYFLYLIWYTTMSIFGHFNNFFFAAHLLDIAMGFKTLRTILSSVTHNGKQVRGLTSRGSQSTDRRSTVITPHSCIRAAFSFNFSFHHNFFFLIK